MTPEILSQLMSRMESQPRPLAELHRAAAAAGSSWMEDQVALLLECLPAVERSEGLYSANRDRTEDSAVRALLEIARATPIPAAALMARLPRRVLATPAALCEIARNHPELELVGRNRIRRR